MAIVTFDLSGTNESDVYSCRNLDVYLGTVDHSNFGSGSINIYMRANKNLEWTIESSKPAMGVFSSTAVNAFEFKIVSNSVTDVRVTISTDE